MVTEGNWSDRRYPVRLRWNMLIDNFNRVKIAGVKLMICNLFIGLGVGMLADALGLFMGILVEILL